MVKSIKMDCRVNIMLRTWGLVARLPFLTVCVCVCDRQTRGRNEQFIICNRNISARAERPHVCVFK